MWYLELPCKLSTADPASKLSVKMSPPFGHPVAIVLSQVVSIPLLRVIPALFRNLLRHLHDLSSTVCHVLVKWVNKCPLCCSDRSFRAETIAALLGLAQHQI